MSSPSELTLDYKPNTNTYPMIQRRFGDQPEAPTQKIEDFLARLEEERLKIEAFKRELPLCMQLLNNAMEIYRRQLETYQSCGQGASRLPVLEEFITLSNMTINGATEKSPPATSEKANWMVSAQLWSPAGDQAAKQQHPLDIVPVKESVADPTYDMSTKLALDSKHRNGGAFLPFSKEKITGKGPGLGRELALASADKELEEKRSLEMDNGVKRESVSSMNGLDKSSEQGIKGGSNSGEGQVAAGAAGQSTHRKARRCWSPDLHRRFVNALQMLGGSQVATPKQIRELMKVDGLTNDEVKSHLQKYRLHTRRPIQPPQPPATAAPQLVVLGGIWVPPEYAAAAAGVPTIYGAHPVSTGAAAHYPIPADFYASPPPPHGPHRLHRHHLHRAAVPDKARVHSPDSELRSGADRSESIEEGEERDADDDEEQEEDQEEMEEVKADDKALVPVDQSNGSGGDVALKF